MQEMEAEIYAHGVMRYHGIPVPRVMTKEARANVWVKIFWARRSGITWIDPEARRYARYNKSSQALVQRYRAMDEAKKKPPRRAA
jgi:hypothetical protein